jgi:hypothetical protein
MWPWRTDPKTPANGDKTLKHPEASSSSGRGLPEFADFLRFVG